MQAECVIERTTKKIRGCTHIPATLIFLLNNSIALSPTPDSFMVAFGLERSRPSNETLCSATGIPDYDR